jgi:penicillin-binding protein-related factor A (putative recombinase)
MYAIECKATNKTSLPFANITDFQWEHLLKMSKEKGVVAGILCWYVAFDVTVFIPIQRLQICKEEGWKSINHIKAVSLPDVFVIPGRKKRIFFDYDMQSFFEHFSS